MNRVQGFALRCAGVAVAAIGLTSAVYAQAQQPPAAGAQPPAASKAAGNENPFAPQPAPPLPAGMTGASTDDPRYKLTPGLFDAGETSMGMKHLALVKKPEAFTLGTNNPDDPKVAATMGQLGMGNAAKIPKDLQMVMAELGLKRGAKSTSAGKPS